MARSTKHSKTDLCRSSVLMPFAQKPTSTQSLQDQLIETRLRIEQAKLAQLEADAPRGDVKYMRYEDMPPPSPEQEAEFHERFRKLIHEIAGEKDEGPEAGQTLQEWLIEQGAIIPDLPEWKVPLYLDKF